MPGPEDEHGHVCAACGDAIVKGVQFLRVGSKIYHSNHFVCAHCGTKFGSGIYFEKEGKPYCEADYNSLFMPKCAHCNESISGDVMEALDGKYHPLCFKCSACGASLGEEFYSDGKKPLCAACHLPKCAGCGKAIDGGYIKALELAFHPDCFHCSECPETFPDGKFYQDDRRAFCLKHFNLKKKYGFCATCNEPIIDHFVEVENERYHANHFQCHFCGKELMTTNADGEEISATIRRREGKFSCEGCATK